MKLIPESEIAGAVIQLTNGSLNWMPVFDSIGTPESRELLVNLSREFPGLHTGSTPSSAFALGDPRAYVFTGGYVCLKQGKIGVLHLWKVCPEVVSVEGLQRVASLQAKYRHSEVFARKFPRKSECQAAIYVFTPLVETIPFRYTDIYNSLGEDVALSDIPSDLYQAASVLDARNPFAVDLSPLMSSPGNESDFCH
jgi:hypothetical protein